ncbi:hypothetical protein J3E69DRAFT_326094 [Trichoderma sp. SZMC 28015]
MVDVIWTVVFSPSPVSLFCVFFLFRAFIRSNGLAHGYPLFGWQIAFVCIRLYTTFP